MLTFISGNTHKVRECERILGAALAHESLPLDEIQSIDPLPVFEHKARRCLRGSQPPRPG